MRRWRAVPLAALAASLVTGRGFAQTAGGSAALKRGAPAPGALPACQLAAPSRTPTGADRRQARELSQRAQQAAILGDRASARDQLTQATRLDPTDADLAYQLARVLDAAGTGAAAAREYCRFLSLTPNAPEAAEARERAAALALGPGRGRVSDETLAAFRTALAAYDGARLVEAETALDTVTAREPQWADAYYDRALVRLARGRSASAVADFERYLRLKPEAEDRAAVVARIEALRRAALSPGRALSLGLLIPGAGQFYTGRPVGGFLSLGGFGVALGCALQQRTTATTTSETALDPFGNPYTFPVTRYQTRRPCLVPGALAAGAIAVASAFEAFSFARRSGEQNRVALSVVPEFERLALRVTVR
jgi:tetratricopeptide (TPR) repeat protein